MGEAKRRAMGRKMADGAREIYDEMYNDGVRVWEVIYTPFNKVYQWLDRHKLGDNSYDEHILIFQRGLELVTKFNSRKESYISCLLCGEPLWAKNLFGAAFAIKGHGTISGKAISNLVCMKCFMNAGSHDAVKQKAQDYWKKTIFPDLRDITDNVTEEHQA